MRSAGAGRVWGARVRPGLVYLVVVGSACAVMLLAGATAARSTPPQPRITISGLVGKPAGFALTLTNTMPAGSPPIDAMTVQLLGGVVKSFKLDGYPPFVDTKVQGAVYGYPLNIELARTINGSGQVQGKLALGAVFKVCTSTDALASANCQDVSFRLKPNCDTQRAARDAAKAKVAAAEAVLKTATAQRKDAEDLLKGITHQLEIIDNLIRTLDNGKAVGVVVILDEDIKDLRDAEAAADSAVGDSIGTQSDARKQVNEAKAELAKAEKELAACETGSSGASLSHTLNSDLGIAAPLSCGSEQAVFAAAQARAGELALGARRLERTGLRPAEQRLHAAIAKLTRALAQPAASKYRSQINPVLALVRHTDAIMIGAVHQLDQLEKSAKAAAASVPKAKTALARCRATPPPPSVSISEDDTWAYNTTIGKGNVCIDVRTTPAQASVSATLSGPNGYQAKLGKTSLKTDGSIQISSPITVGGDYTKTLIVYAATGKQSATVTKTFTVAAPPQDGPATTPPCLKPTS